ncbi:hypothetical protein [Nostoc sp.]|uniref:hypothetical protein n=1 Tax=Nostoc sp. TaxID=1180 RepID=UPI002FF5B647
MLESPESKLILHMGKQRPVACTLRNACQKIVDIVRGEVNSSSGWAAGNKYLCESLDSISATTFSFSLMSRETRGGVVQALFS